ncbi:hypothetical protein EKO23_12660 [Nocardioides guangzhouensis]|uniref:Glycoside hydrolase n=1 Tax=Nocardioides guangzhouensis TaxID=2497878 RepID=A0A4Q4ZBF6_9ACTN|nr:family 43 glycosylhydrolase [Nocardioides guangzhouensis]RYP85330.1 hypothetical protein EKO23_12660 [Nocardioides guangzhouensis]
MSRPRTARTALWAAVVLACVLTSTVMLPRQPASSSGPAPRADVVPTPLIWERGFADPAVVEVGDGLLGVATGARNVGRASAARPGGPWSDLPVAFEVEPSWVVPGQQVWAPDLARVDGRWLLYYAVRVEGVGATGRCIAVAEAPSPDVTFTPLDERPLVCPARATTPTASDTLWARARSLPQQGVIDPSLFRRRGRLYLLYRTQGVPSTIRMVRLAASGTRVAPRQRSRELVRSPGIIENPVLVQRRGFVLFTSEGWFGHCRYRTRWQRSGSLWDWGESRPRVLLDRASTGLCGPGGADVLRTSTGATRIFFHGWVCKDSPTPCPAGFRIEEGVSKPGSRRALYGARLGWTRAGRPYLGRFFGS